MRWRQPNAGLARAPCHQSSWVQRSAFLKYEDLIELTPSPRADGLEHSVNAATDYCKQILVTLIAPLGAQRGAGWPRSAGQTLLLRALPEQGGRRSLSQTATGTSPLQLRNWQLLGTAVTGFSMLHFTLLIVLGKQRPLNTFSFVLRVYIVTAQAEAALSFPRAGSALLPTHSVPKHSVHPQTSLNIRNTSLYITYSLATFSALPE